MVTADGRVIRTSRRARKSAAGYDLTRLFVGSEGTLGIITEVTLRLHAIPEAISAATCSFATIDGAVDTVVQSIQLGIPLARVEILDDMQIRAVNRWSHMDLPELTTLFFEFHGSERYVAEQVETVRELATANGGGEFRWAERTEDARRLWKARHEAYYAAVNLRPGAIGWATDVCVPISRLAECIVETKRDLEASSVPATILGHVGDGNFHVVFSIDPNQPAELDEVDGDQPQARPPRAGDGRHLHRRTWHRAWQAGLAGRGTGRSGRPDARDQAGARSARIAQPGQDFRRVTRSRPLAPASQC